MKKYLLLLLTFIGLSKTMLADDSYHPFIEDDKQWTVISADYNIYWTKKYFIDGDSVVGDYACKKLMCQINDYTTKTCDTQLHSLIFEQNAKVLYFPANAKSLTQPIMLYDFSATKGDKVLLGGLRENIYGVKCYQIWKELVLIHENKVFRGQLATECDETLAYVDEDSDLQLYEWYEGVGSIFHPFEKTYFNKNMGGAQCWLYECSVKDNVIYSNTMGITLNNANCDNIENALKEVPAEELLNISGNVLTLKGTDANAVSAIFSADGRQVMSFTGNTADISSLPQGLYVLRTSAANGTNLTAKFVK